MPETPDAVVFDIGRVLFDWNLRHLYAKLIADRFSAAVKRLGLEKPRLALDHTQFRRPLEQGGQQDLFGKAEDI